MDLNSRPHASSNKCAGLIVALVLRLPWTDMELELRRLVRLTWQLRVEGKGGEECSWAQGQEHELFATQEQPHHSDLPACKRLILSPHLRHATSALPSMPHDCSTAALKQKG